MSVSLLLALAATPAQAESEIIFRANRPVLIFVDGRQTPLTSNLRMRAADLDPGVHEVEVKGVFGKTLYEGEIELNDWTLAYAEWNDGDLAVYRTEKLDKRRLRARQSPWADEPVEPEEGQDEVEPEVTETVESEGLSEEAPVAVPAPDEPAPVVEPAPVEQAAVVEPEVPLAVPAPEAGPPVPSEPEPAPPPVGEEPESTPGAILVDKTVASDVPRSAPAVTIQAREGVRFQLQHGDSALYVTVQDGAFVVDFPTGESD